MGSGFMFSSRYLLRMSDHYWRYIVGSWCKCSDVSPGAELFMKHGETTVQIFCHQLHSHHCISYQQQLINHFRKYFNMILNIFKQSSIYIFIEPHHAWLSGEEMKILRSLQ